MHGPQNLYLDRYLVSTRQYAFEFKENPFGVHTS